MSRKLIMRRRRANENFGGSFIPRNNRAPQRYNEYQSREQIVSLEGKSQLKIEEADDGHHRVNHPTTATQRYNEYQSREQIISLEGKSQLKIEEADDGHHRVNHPTTAPQRYNEYQSREQIISLEGKSQWKIEEADDGYHRVNHPTTYADTLLHLFRGNIGSGLLAMGDAFKNGGIIFSLIVTIILRIICVHSQHLLVNCSEDMHRKTKREKPPGFAGTVGLVFEYGPPKLQPFASTMKNLANTFLCLTQLGFCSVYIVFIANNVEMICDQNGVHMDLSVHMVFVVVPVLLLCMIRNLKYLTPLSTLANVLMAVGVGAVLYETAIDLPPVQSREYVASWHQLPLYFGTAIYAFEGIGLVLPLKNEMRNPEQFQKTLGVLNVGMIVVGSIFVMVGLLGYLKWGEEVAGSLTLNLTPGQPLSTTVQVVISIATLLTYPLQFYVAVAITWPALKEDYGQSSPIAKELGYRAFLVLLTLLVAVSIPQLGLFISLVGAISSTALVLVLPPVLELVSTYQDNNCIPWLMTIKDAVIISLGVFIFVTGTYQSIAFIVKAF